MPRTQIGGSLIKDPSIGVSDIIDKAVTYAKIQDVTTARLLGRTTAGAGSVEELAAAAVKTFLALVAADVGLGNVTNESKATMFTNPVFTGNPTAPTPAANDTDTSVATTAFVDAGFARLNRANTFTTAQTISVAGQGLLVQNTTAGGSSSIDVKTDAGYARFRMFDGTAQMLSLEGTPAYGGGAYVGFRTGVKADGNPLLFFITVRDASSGDPVVIRCFAGADAGKVSIGNSAGGPITGTNVLFRDGRASGGKSTVEIRTASGDTGVQFKVTDSSGNTKFSVDEVGNVVTLGTVMINGKRQTNGSAAPASGAYIVGDICWNTAPSAGGTPGWVCVTAGSPGTWKAMPNLAA